MVSKNIWLSFEPPCEIANNINIFVMEKRINHYEKKDYHYKSVISPAHTPDRWQRLSPS